MKKKTLIPWLIIGLLVLIYLSGPTPPTPVYSNTFPEVPDIKSIETYVKEYESTYTLRPDNEAKIIWSDSVGKPTEWVILYLHGFSASHMEGHPTHRDIASYYGANLYLARIAGHGLDTTQPLLGFTPDAAWDSAKRALAIAQKLGKKVLIMSTSTGGTLAMKLAAEYPGKVHALVNMSPNIRIKQTAARILNDPWGKQIASLIYGKQRVIHHKQEEAKKYWDTIYNVESLVALEELLETTMHDSLYNKIKCPVLSLYYYRDEEHQDDIVDVSVIPFVHLELGTSYFYEKYVPLSSPGDHVIGSSIKSNDIQIVEWEIIKFCDKALKMKRV